MSRNGSGTMTIPNTMVAGEVITAASHNENYDDIGDEITNSVAVDGQSTMTGPLKAANGTAAAPSVTFGSDTDSGLYRIGANNIGVAVNGAKVGDFSTAGYSVTGTLISSGALTVTSGGATITAGGLTVTAGGATITAGGLTVTAGTIVNPVGSVGAPSYSFAGDSNSGFYRIGADNIGAAVNGAKVLDISTTGLAVTGAISATSGITATNVAAQSDQETGTSTTTFVSPGRQQYHPSAAKAWAHISSAGVVQSSYNVTSTTHPGTGQYTATFTVANSSTSYAVIGTTAAAGILYTTGLAAGTVSYNTVAITTGNGTDMAHYIAVFGDQ